MLFNQCSFPFTMRSAGQLNSHENIDKFIKRESHCKTKNLMTRPTWLIGNHDTERFLCYILNEAGSCGLLCHILPQGYPKHYGITTLKYEYEILEFVWSMDIKKQISFVIHTFTIIALKQFESLFSPISSRSNPSNSLGKSYFKQNTYWMRRSISA